MKKEIKMESCFVVFCVPCRFKIYYLHLNEMSVSLGDAVYVEIWSCVRLCGFVLLCVCVLLIDVHRPCVCLG